jgi:hypothetical protein
MKPKLVGVLATMAALSLPLFAVEIKLPADSSRLVESSLPGYALAGTYCYTCHSMDYVRIQPPSSRAYWRANVVKMQKTFGAPIPDDAVESIVEYLVRTYGTERAPDAAAAAPSAEAAKKSPKK